jgi:purine-binding chemotaxis protein CheW
MSEASKSQLSERYLVFSLGSERYALPLLAVKEVIAVPEFTSIPFTPSHFLGMMNLRGQVISVIDLRLKFGMKPQPSAETSVIICDFSSVTVGVVVDSINSVLSCTPDQIQPKPEIDSHKKTDFIMGVTKAEDRLVVLIDISKALDMADLAAIKQAQASKVA